MIRLFKHYIPHAVLLLGLLDFALLLLAGDLAWQFGTAQIGSSMGPLTERLFPLGGFALVTSAALISVGTYGPDALRSMRFACARMMVGVSLAILALALLDFVVPGATFWRSTLLYAMILALALLVANRLVTGGLLGTSAFRRRILVLGTGERAKRLNGVTKKQRRASRKSGACRKPFCADSRGSLWTRARAFDHWLGQPAI